MSDKLNAALGPNTDAVHNDLTRRRELSKLTKPELITHAIRLERLIEQAEQ